MSNHNFNGETYDERLGLMSSFRWRHDPKTVLFMLSRYKWVSAMLAGYNNVLEVGCGDAFGSHLVAQTVGYLKCIDIDREMISSANKHPKITYECTNEITTADAIYALDVIEHIPHEESKLWLAELASKAPLVIIGMPSLESQEYASPLSKANHVNCMSAPDLKAMMKEHFSHVFMFSQNDEMVHTGFHKLAHYVWAIGVRSMAYDGTTNRGNPTNYELHKEFMDHSISSQESGQQSYANYDDWYENEKKKKTAPNTYVNPEPK